tara:strand:- start:471 stop:2300 length:1830 start_codon:yes stop_codon:yes gene_type:complete
MAIPDEEVENILDSHDKMVAESRYVWRRHRAAYEDKFWEEYDLGGASMMSRENMSPIRVQINLIKPWVSSYVSSLFYKGVRTIVRPDDVVRKKEITVDDARSVQALGDRFLSNTKAESLAEQAYQMGLLYGESAFKMGKHEPSNHIKDQDPMDLVWLSVIPPWEAVWDRRSTQDDMRYTGHTFFMPYEQAAKIYNIPPEIHAGPKPDVVMHGLNHDPQKSRQDENYIRVLEFYDFTAIHNVGKKETLGEYRVYLISTESKGQKIHKVFEGPMPYTKASGEPQAPIIPIILENTPEFPLKGVPPVATMYELNAERNLVATFLANAFRRDIARVLLFRKDEVDDDVLSAIESGQDMVLAGLEAETLEGTFKYLEQQGVSSTLFEYAQLLDKSRQEASGTADFTRGTAGEYLTATEVMRLNDYTETTIGRIRKRMDKALSSLVTLYVRVLIESMRSMKRDSVKLKVSGEDYEFKRESLDGRYEVTLVDTANTPVAEQQRRQEFELVQGKLLELIQVATEAPGAVSVMAKRQIEYLVTLYDLPDDMGWNVISKEIDAEPEELPEAMPPEGMAPPPEAVSPEGMPQPPESFANADPVVQQAVMEAMPQLLEGMK